MKGKRERAEGSWKAALVSAVALLALHVAAPAQAAPRTIAEGGSGAGQVHLPVGAAVDQGSGRLYVADRNNFRVNVFAADGSFLLAWGWGVADGLSQEPQSCGPAASPPTKRCFKASSTAASGAGAIAPESVAVEQGSGSGNVYVADVSNRRVSKFSAAGEFLFMVGKNVNQTDAADICTAADLQAGDACGRGETGSGPNEFTSPLALAIDSGARVWVGDADRIASLDAAGAPGAEIALPGAGAIRSLAVDSSGDFYVKSDAQAGIRKLQAGTGNLLYTLDEAGAARSVAVDGADNVYVGDATSPYRFKVYDPAGEQVSQFGAGQVVGTPGSTIHGANALAVAEGAGARTLYVASSRSALNESAVQAFEVPPPGPLIDNQRAEELEPTSATLAAQLNPEGNETTYRFEYGTDAGYGQLTATETLEEGGAPYAGFDAKPVQAQLEGLIPDTTYHFRLVAINHCKAAEPAVECTVEGPDTTFTTRPAVAIEAQWASQVAARSAALHAELDPLGVAGSWWLEYGESAAYGNSTAEAALPAQFGAVAVGALLSGLEPATTYHYRFAARDEREGAEYVVHGEDRTFTTQLAELGFALPDARAWEMVSPPNKFGGRVGVDFDGEGQIQAAADGEALAYLSLGSIEAEPDGNRAIEDSSVLARRGAGGRWHSKDLTPPNASVRPIPLGQGREYRLFSADLGKALLEPRDTAPLSPRASERTPYLRHDGEPPLYVPLISGKEAFANVPEGTEFGGDPDSEIGAVRVRGATAGLEHVVVHSDVALAAGAGARSLYRWAEGAAPSEQLQEASVKPEGGAAVSAQLGSGAASLRNAISQDGQRIFWSTFSGDSPNALYLRDMEAEETTRLDAVQPGGLGSGTARPVFWGADPAGSVAFFTDTRQLSEDSGAATGKADLYRCEISSAGGGAPECALSDLTPEGAGGQAAEVLGVAAGMSEDASRIYFVARGVLDEAPNEQGESALGGQPNLYLWEEGAGARFIARLAEEDERNWGSPAPGVAAVAPQVSAAASPGGRYLAFMSQRSLTGYDNRDAGSGERAQEVFRYDARADELICASCNPTGGRPAGLRSGPVDAPLAFDPLHLWDGRALAAVLPEASRTGVESLSLYRARAIHDNGRLFFNAADALVPADSNGNWDVYQYEPSGLGDCGAAAGGAGVARSAGGCVALISSGSGSEEAAFLDAGVGGEDIFFLSSAQLSVLDEDQVTDVYDARVDGVAATRSPRAECLGEACQPAASAPQAQTPASAAFRGPGNLRARRSCGAIGRRAAKLSRRARALRRGARRAQSPKAARRARGKAKRLGRKASGISKRAKRCRRAQRRAGR